MPSLRSRVGICILTARGKRCRAKVEREYRHLLDLDGDGQVCAGPHAMSNRALCLSLSLKYGTFKQSARNDAS